MINKPIYEGAEAIILKDKKNIIKKRINKKYRHPKLDSQIIKKRTKAEIKILKKVQPIINSPILKEQKNENEIIMEYIVGDKLSEKLNKYSKEKQEKVLTEIGKLTAKIHSENIIHGDLTTSNLIYSKKTEKIYFIDFGLGFLNGKYEDKAVDIHLLKQALEAKHFQNWENLFLSFKRGYLSINKIEGNKVFEKLKSIEKRGRYKE